MTVRGSLKVIYFTEKKVKQLFKKRTKFLSRQLKSGLGTFDIYYTNDGWQLNITKNLLIALLINDKKFN